SLPAAPAAELFQIVAAHQPDEIELGKTPLQGLHGVDCVDRVKRLFQRTHMDARFMRRDLPGALKPRRQGCHAGAILEWIAGADQPPDGIEMQAFERRLADIEMSGMGGIEGTAQKADAKTVSRRTGRNNPAHGKTIKRLPSWPRLARAAHHIFEGG